MPQLFSTRKPRDAAAGFSSGLKSIGKGVAAGVACLVSAPIVGAMEGGVGGFAKGLGTGLLGAVALPVAGAAVGATQMVRGAVNTPGAINAKVRGKFWDAETRAWTTEDPSKAILMEALNEPVSECGARATTSPNHQAYRRKLTAAV